MAPDIRTDQLYANIAATPNQLYAGFAIDTDNPVISKFNRLDSPPEYVNGAWIKGAEANLNMIDDVSLLWKIESITLGLSKRKPAANALSYL